MKKLLVANRGEIARRIIRTARKMGIHSVAVASKPDLDAPFALEADEVHLLGEAPPRESYLAASKIIGVAQSAGVDAIHPGYGFLAESAEFAEQVRDAGFLFVGPSQKTMRQVGSKLTARKIAEEAGIPLVPGSPVLSTLEEAKAAALSVGYPVMLKAALGGGGIGMSLVPDEKRLERAFVDTAKKGQLFFGSSAVYLEKWINRPAHVEVQILGDGHGKVVALGERDCTIQRRHQKVLEETPSLRIDAGVRAKMLEAAVRLGESVQYESAGTVEMLYSEDESGQAQFFFLEVNARLQVEHPVTEMVTGLDLVELQLLIAQGSKLPKDLDDLKFSGHAIEARICAEDPKKRFFPSPGTIEELRFPSQQEGVRVDSGVAAGSIVSPAYDSLLAKLIVWGASREEAIKRLETAVASTHVTGVKCNLEIFPAILAEPEFRSGRHDTSFLSQVLGYKS